MADLTILLLKDKLDFMQQEIDRKRNNEIYDFVKNTHKEATCLLGYSHSASPEQRIEILAKAYELANRGVATIKAYHNWR